MIALDGVDFDLRRGEVHVLFGENGAGKSTLINIIAGTYPPDTGTFKYQGKEIAYLTPHGARVIGISPVFQEFSLVPELTVEENLFLGREMTAGGFLNRAAMRARARDDHRANSVSTCGPTARCRELSRAHQQMVEIAKAFLTEVRLLILDEPTASLTEAEAAKLFDLIAKLKASGVGIIYVSHRMREIKQIADRITVLRDGRKIKTVEAGDVSETELVELMTGRKIGVLFPTHRPPARPEACSRSSMSRWPTARSTTSASTRGAGEITGIAGLVGCGKSEIVRAIFGLEPIETGTIRVRGKEIARRRRRARCCKRASAIFRRTASPRAWRWRARCAKTSRWRRSICRPSPGTASFSAGASGGPCRASSTSCRCARRRSSERWRHFSGGNRQKVLLARGLTRDISVYLFDEPTVGIDVGAKVEVYELMKRLLATGVAIVLVSSDLPEVLNLSHRLYVMHRSRMVAELLGADINEPAVLSHFFREQHAGDGTAEPAAANGPGIDQSATNA